MAESIYDIIARFSFEVGRSDIPTATAELKKQAEIIKALDQQAKQYAQSLSNAAKTDTELQRKLTVELNRVNAAREKAAANIRNIIVSNKQVQQDIKIELGLIQQLTDKMNDLRHARERAKTVNDIKAINAELAKTQTQLQNLTTVGKGGGILASLGLAGGSGGSVARQIGQGLLFGLGVGGGFGLITRAVSGVVELIQESGKLAKEIEGVEIAFNRLNRPDLLDNLREATKNTVSDLDLMKFAVQSKNYELPLDRLAEMFAFARNRARETGESVDYLVNSLVLGIGRESPKILDNLGINVRKVREEFNRTGNYATAVFNIIAEQAPAGTKEIKTLADELDRMNTILVNQQTELGKTFNQLKSLGTAAGLDVLQMIFNPFDTKKGAGALLFGESNLSRTNEAIKAIEALQEQEKQTNEAVNNTFLQQFKTFQEQYNASDKENHKAIRQEAKNHLDQLLALSGQFAFNNQAILMRAYSNLSFTKEKPQLSELTQQSLFTAGFDRETLSDLQNQIKLRRNILTVADTDEIARLDKIDDEITRQIRLIDGKVKKVKDATNAIGTLTATLKKQIEELNKAIEISDMQGRQVTEASIRKTIDTQRQAALNEIGIERESAARRGLLNPVTSLLFDEKTRLTKEKFRQDEKNDIENYNRNRIEQERAFRNNLISLELNYAKQRLDIQTKAGDDTLDALLQVERLTAIQERAAVTDRYLKLLDEAHKLGLNTVQLEKDFDNELLLLEEKSQQERLNVVESYYRQRITLINAAHDLLISTIDAELADEVSVYREAYEDDKLNFNKYNREKAQAAFEAHLRRLKAIKEQAQAELNAALEAEQSLPAGADPLARNAALTRVNNARVGLESATSAQSLAGTNRSNLAVSIFGTDLIEENITKQEQWQLVINKTTEAWTTLANAAGSALTTIIGLQQASLDREIEIRKTRVQAAIELAEKGNTEILKQEQDRLDSALRAREESARRQIVINAALQTSNALVAVAQAAATGPAAIVLIPAIIAALISGFAAVSAASQNTQTFPGFKKGGYTGDGNPNDAAGTVHKKEFVFDEKATSRLGKHNLEALRRGDKFDMSALQNQSGYAQKSELKEVVSELREVKEAIGNIHFSARNELGADGLHQLVETTAQKAVNKWR